MMQLLLKIFVAITITSALQACQPMKTAPELPPIVNDDMPPDAAVINNTEVINQEMSPSAN